MSNKIDKTTKQRRARLGGLVSARQRTPEQRQAWASAGGLASARRLTPEQRRARAQAAAKARYQKSQ